MGDDILSAGEGLEVWRGGVNTWECDEMGHMNARFYVARAAEGLVGLAAAMGLEGAFRSTAEATLLISEQHIRFLREARAGEALHMIAGVIALGEDEAHLALRLIHSATGEPAASFQAVVVHATARGERRFAWSDRSRARAERLKVTVPDALAPRSLAFNPAKTVASLASAESMGLTRLGVGALGPEDCDVFGRMRAAFFMGRISDGVHRLVGAVREAVASTAPEPPARVGGAVLEYRLLHKAFPRAGDRFEIRSGFAAMDHRTHRLVHWMLDPATGRPWASSEAVGVFFDLDKRKIIPISDAARALVRDRITPGLAL